MRKNTIQRLVVIISLALSGCASVSVTKLDPVTGKPAEGAQEGLRFYMPRPYISVTEPFVVGSDVYIANGEVSPDGQYVLLTEVPKGLEKVLPASYATGAKQGMGRMAVPSSAIRKSTAAAAGRQESLDESGGNSTKSTPVTGTPTSASTASASPTTAPPSGGSGILNYKATNDNTAYAITPLPRYYNIVWLPDFDEQYAVSAKAGLGNAGVTINMGQGWSLQGLEGKSDNSALAMPLLDFYKTSLSALQKVATAKIGLLGGLVGGQQSLSEDAASKAQATPPTFSGGTKVTVKVTKARVVAPGLYPILKPKEIRDFPSVLAANADIDSRLLRPVPPLTNIAFNTYDVIVIEAAQASGDSALRFHQYGDGNAAQGNGGTPELPNDDKRKTNNPSADKFRAEVNKALRSLATKNKQYFEVTAEKVSPGELKIVANVITGTITGKAAELPSDDSIKKLIDDSAKNHSLDVDINKIVIKR